MTERARMERFRDITTSAKQSSPGIPSYARTNTFFLIKVPDYDRDLSSFDAKKSGNSFP